MEALHNINVISLYDTLLSLITAIAACSAWSMDSGVLCSDRIKVVYFSWTRAKNAGGVFLVLGELAHANCIPVGNGNNRLLTPHLEGITVPFSGEIRVAG